MRRLPLTGLLVAAVLATGCGGKGRKPVFPVKGTVVDASNKPAANALLVFHPADPKTSPRAVATTDSSGAFTLTTYDQGDGAAADEYTVTIQWPTPKKTPLGAEGPDRLKGRLSNPATSTIRFTVEQKSQNEVPRIKLPVP
jgi:hypothetical protein